MFGDTASFDDQISEIIENSIITNGRIEMKEILEYLNGFLDNGHWTRFKLLPKFANLRIVHEQVDHTEMNYCCGQNTAQYEEY